MDTQPYYPDSRGDVKVDITINNLNKAYGNKTVLNNFSCVFKENVVSCIMGRSGVGKTTLISIITGLEEPDSGSIDGISDKKISVVFQENRLCENLSPVSNIRLVCNSKVSKKEIINALSDVGLNDCINQPVRELSGGMKRRVAVLRALFAEYDILLLDEAFKGLDDNTKAKVILFIKSKIKGKTVIMVTHDIDEARQMDAEIITL